MDSVGLGSADEESEASAGDDQAGSSGQGGLEALDGPQSDDVRALGKTFGAGGEYIDVGQCQSADHLAQESGLLLIGFDQCKVEGGSPELDRNSGKASPGPYVENMGRGLVVRPSSTVVGRLVFDRLTLGVGVTGLVVSWRRTFRK